MDILNLDARSLSAALANRDISAVELMQATLARVDTVNSDVNAIVDPADPDALMAEAEAADNMPRKGWLHGIPMAIKDFADVKGLRTTMGSPLFKDNLAQQDSPMVQALRQRGALFIGKTNTPEFGLGSHTFNRVYGTTKNPYDLTRSAGGSSGGAAAALSARMVALADGSDVMGSLRNPAAWNNIYGMLPTRGLVPSEARGEAFLHQLASVGPMARAPQDLADLLTVQARKDWRSKAANFDLPPLLETNRASLKLGWLANWGDALPMEEGILSLSEQTLRQLEELGHSVEPLSAPFSSDEMWHSWITLRSFGQSASLAPYYNNPEHRKQLKDAAIWEVETGRSHSVETLHKASATRTAWNLRAKEVFGNYDVLLLPTAQCWPFDSKLVSPAEVAGVQMDTYHRWMQVAVPAALIGLPVVNIPIGFGENGLPAGLQLIGPLGSDLRLLELAQQWHLATAWPDQRPPSILQQP